MKWFAPLLILIASSLAHANQRAQVDCSQGGKGLALTSIIKPSTLNQPVNVVGSYPSSTVTVYLTGTTNKATLFADNSGTPLANPFSTDATGHGFFYAANGRYDYTCSGSPIVTTFSITDILLNDPTPGANVPFLVATNFAGIDIGAQLNAAIAQICVLGPNNNSVNEVYIPAGYYVFSTTVTAPLNCPLHIWGAGPGQTILNDSRTTSGDSFVVQTGFPNLKNQTLGILDVSDQIPFRMDGLMLLSSGTSGAGVHQINTVGASYDNMIFAVYGAGGCLWLDNQTGGFNERTYVGPRVSFYGCKYGIRATNSNQPSSSGSFFYSKIMDPHFQVPGAGGVDGGSCAIRMEGAVGNLGNPPQMSNSEIRFRVNGVATDGSADICVINGGTISNSFLDVHGEGVSYFAVGDTTGGVTGFGFIPQAVAAGVKNLGTFNFAGCGGQFGDGNCGTENGSGAATAIIYGLPGGSQVGSVTVVDGVGNNNDLSLGNIAASFYQISGPSTACNITGFMSGFNGRQITLFEPFSAPICTYKNTVGSLANNQILLGTGAATQNCQTAQFTYDTVGATNKWVMTFCR